MTETEASTLFRDAESLLDLIDLAEHLLEEGEPIPLDLLVRLDAEGIELKHLGKDSY